MTMENSGSSTSFVGTRSLTSGSASGAEPGARGKVVHHRVDALVVAACFECGAWSGIGVRHQYTRRQGKMRTRERCRIDASPTAWIFT